MKLFFGKVAAVFASTLIAGLSTFGTFTSAAFASRVYYSNPDYIYLKNSRCLTYNDYGQTVGTLQTGYYKVRRYGNFSNGQPYAEVFADFSASGQGWGTVNLPFSCLEISSNRQYNTMVVDGNSIVAARITTDGRPVHLRTTPSLASSLGTLQHGESVEVIEKGQSNDGANWYYVTSVDGLTGWVRSEYIAFD
ncbi:MAG: SH3 domain-containing protein [Lyngbya sp.]|nr:SH3 domain-containing protein [Lyngbya sp.]